MRCEGSAVEVARAIQWAVRQLAEVRVTVPLDVFHEHLAEAARATSPYYEFDALWKAFNVYYATLHREGDRGERALVVRALQRLPRSSYRHVIGQVLNTSFMHIEPIANGRAWVEAGELDHTKHLNARARLGELTNGAEPSLDHVQAVVDVLYVVRCNLAHGLKSRYAMRDQAVLRVTVPALRAVVYSLPVTEPQAEVA